MYDIFLSILLILVVLLNIFWFSLWTKEILVPKRKGMDGLSHYEEHHSGDNPYLDK